jgi:hypothetical protein
MVRDLHQEPVEAVEVDVQDLVDARDAKAEEESGGSSLRRSATRTLRSR